MRNLVILLLLGGLLFVSSCTTKTNGHLQATGEVELVFKALYQGAPFLIEHEYVYENGKSFFFTDFRFYISGLKLIKSSTNNDGNGVEVSEVKLIDFSTISDTPINASRGLSIFTKDIPVGDYDRVQLGIGVAADLNRTDPNDYGDTHPLGSLENYWVLCESYVFSSLKGMLDKDGDGSFNQGVNLQTASDAMYRDFAMVTSLEVKDDDIAQLSIIIDVEKLLVRNPTDFMNIEQNVSQANKDEELMTYIMDNYATAVYIQ